MTRFASPARACLLLAALAAPLAGTLRAGPPARAPLGINLAGVTDWSSEIVFADAFRAARPWISQAKGKPWGQGGPLSVDARGNVLTLAEGQFAETVVWTDFGKRFPGGTLTCLYDGKGRLDFAGDARVTRRDPGRLEVTATPSTGSAFARLTRTDPRDPVRNIRLLLPGHEDGAKASPFTPEFLARWKGFSVFRFMDWQRTNNSPLVAWADRTTLAHQSQARAGGVAVELMVRLCNDLNVEPWFCMPHLASDDFVKEFASLVKAQLKPSLRVHVEYSNECWNGQFQQARYCAERGKQLGLSDNAYQAQLRFYSRRSVEVFKIWEGVFGGRERLVRVLAPQSANPWTGEQVVGWKDASRQADALAIAPYFGNRWGDPKKASEVAKLDADALVKELAADVAQSRKQVRAYAALAKKSGLTLVAYEAGQHLAGHGGAENNEALTRLFQAANRHPGMKNLYRDYLLGWSEEGGGLCCIFSSMGRYSKWGSWGLLEYAGQPDAETPKLEAVREYLGR